MILFGNKPLYGWRVLRRIKIGVEEMPIRVADDKGDGNGKVPVIKCGSCGAEIMLVPDVKLISEAIEAHVAKHMQKVKDPDQAEVEAERVRDDLIAKLLYKASGI